MGKIEFETGTLIASSIQKLSNGKEISLHGAFNSMINTFVCNDKTNADLIIFLRIHFQKVNPLITGKIPHVENRWTPAVEWKGDEWEKWKRRFISQSQEFWSGKFWLITPVTYNGLNWPSNNPTHRCNLYCKLKITDHPSSAGAHFNVRVIKVKQWTESNMDHWNSLDLREEQISKVHGILQKGAIHEVGHLIGLNHPGMKNPGCNLNEDVCYITSGGDDTGIMGKGNVINTEHAKPWQMSAAALTGTKESDWKISMGHPYPRPSLLKK